MSHVGINVCHFSSGAVSSAAKASTQPHPGEKDSKDPHSHFSQPQQRSGTVENHLHTSDISNYEQSKKHSSINDINREDVNSSIIALMSEDPPSLSVIMNESSCIQDESSIDLELQTPKPKSPKHKGIGKKSKNGTTLTLNNNSPSNLFSDFQNKSDQKEHVDSVDETHDILELAGPLNCSTPNVKWCPRRKTVSSSNINAGQRSNNKDRRDSEKTARKNNAKSPCVTNTDFTSPPSTNVSISSVSPSGTGKVSDKTVRNYRNLCLRNHQKQRKP